METYIDHGAYIFFDAMLIPKDTQNDRYNEFIRLQQAGEAQLVADTIDISMIKKNACSRIDAAAERLRQRVLTPGSGQCIEYQRTKAEALAAITAAATGTELTAATYPFLAAEQAALAATTGNVTLLQVAQAVQSDAATTDAQLAAIKAARRTAKLRIAAATDATGITTAEESVNWPAPETSQ